MPREFYRAEITVMATDLGVRWVIDLLDAEGASAHTFTAPTLVDAEHEAAAWVADHEED